MSEPEGEWDFYFTEIEDRPASIALDLSIIERAPVKSLPRFVVVTIPMREPREDGLTTNDEAQALWDLEDQVVSALGEQLGAVHVARVTTGGRRDLLFYAPAHGSLDLALTGVTWVPYEPETFERRDR